MVRGKLLGSVPSNDPRQIYFLNYDFCCCYYFYYYRCTKKLFFPHRIYDFFDFEQSPKKNFFFNFNLCWLNNPQCFNAITL
jgi:hypothetical protein